MAISDDFRGDAWSAEGDQPLVLLTIEHADITTIRLVDNRVDVTSGGDIYTAKAFTVRLPDSLEDAPSGGRLRIDNVNRELGEAMRDISSPADVTIELIRQADPDTIETSWPAMQMTNVRFNFLTVEGDLTFENLSREPNPFMTFSPAEFPGVVQ